MMPKDEAQAWIEQNYSATPDEWRDLALTLARVVERFLGEFDEMCRASDHKAEALVALARLRAAGV